MKNTEVALKSDKGEDTQLTINPFAMDDTAAATIRKDIEAANAAEADSFTDITPVYWQAVRDETKIMVFLGWKRSVKVDDKTGEEIEETYFAVFHDGNRQVVAGQIALKDAMFGRPTGKTYKITCLEAPQGKAKKFLVEQFNG